MTPPDAAGVAPAPERVASVCPHDCPSTCALEVDRLDAHTVGRLRGAAANGYTAGVICAKVARYAERVHHPGRSEEHTSELHSLMRISYAVFCLKKKISKKFTSQHLTKL